MFVIGDDQEGLIPNFGAIEGLVNLLDESFPRGQASHRVLAVAIGAPGGFQKDEVRQASGTDRRLEVLEDPEITVARLGNVRHRIAGQRRAGIAIDRPGQLVVPQEGENAFGAIDLIVVVQETLGCGHQGESAVRECLGGGGRIPMVANGVAPGQARKHRQLVGHVHAHDGAFLRARQDVPMAVFLALLPGHGGTEILDKAAVVGLGPGGGSGGPEQLRIGVVTALARVGQGIKIKVFVGGRYRVKPTRPFPGC